MPAADLFTALAGTGATASIVGALAGRLTGRTRYRAEIARLQAERDQVAANAVQAIAQAASTLADELRAELARMADELAAARTAAETARAEAVSLRIELAAARTEIERLRALVAAVARTRSTNQEGTPPP